MKKIYSADGSTNLRAINPDWTEMVIASSIGPNLALYSLTDPEGEHRAEQLKEAIRETIRTAYSKLSIEPDFDVYEFTKTAQSVCLQAYSDFTTKRAAHLLANGMPTASRIIKLSDN